MRISIILLQLFAILYIGCSQQIVGNVYYYSKQDLPTLEQKDQILALGLAKLRIVLKQHCQLEIGKLLQVTRVVVQGVKFNILAQTEYSQLEALVYVIPFEDNSTQVLDIKFSPPKQDVVTVENTSKLTTTSISPSKSSSIGSNTLNSSPPTNSTSSQKNSSNIQTNNLIISVNLQKVQTQPNNVKPEQSKNISTPNFKFPQLKKVCDARRKQLSQNTSQLISNTSKMSTPIPSSTSPKQLPSGSVPSVNLMLSSPVLPSKLESSTNVVSGNGSEISTTSSKTQTQNELITQNNSTSPQIENGTASNLASTKLSTNQGTAIASSAISSTPVVSSLTKPTSTTLINVSALLSADSSVKPTPIAAPANNLRTNGAP